MLSDNERRALRIYAKKIRNGEYQENGIAWNIIHCSWGEHICKFHTNRGDADFVCADIAESLAYSNKSSA